VGWAVPVYSDALTFLTRFVTHFCAPGFFFLMGVGMALWALSRQEQGWSKWHVIRHFLIRAGVILAIKFLVVNRAWGNPLYFGVLWALAGTMILGSLLLWLKPRHLLVLTGALLIGMELLTPAPNQWGTQMRWLTRIFLVPGRVLGSAGETILWSNYPVLPWLELVTLGIVFGKWLGDDPRKAFSLAWKLGAAFLVLLGLLILYPLCRLYGRLKKSQSARSVLQFF
jgi:uncharacterized membrane protein